MNKESFTVRILRHYAPAVRTLGATLLLLAAMGSVAAADVSLELALDRDRVYPGEAIPVTVTLRIIGETVRNVAYPLLAAPGGGTVSFAPPVQSSAANDPGTTIFKFFGEIVGKKSGTMQIDPATLNLEVMEQASGSAAFFGGLEPRQVSIASPSATLMVLPLPSAGRPDSFSGAVGSFTMSVVGKPDSVASGDPLTVMTTIRGKGSLTAASCPQLNGPGLHGYPVRAKHRAGMLICEQVIVPSAAAIPSVEWSYFDPQIIHYRTLKSTLPHISAARTPIPASQQVKTDNSSQHNPDNVPWSAASLLLGGCLLATLFVAGFFFLKRKRHQSTDQHPLRTSLLEQHLAEAKQQILNGNPEGFSVACFRGLQELLAKFVDLPATSLTIGTLLHDEAHYLPAAVRSELTALFSACDQMRYGRWFPSIHEQNQLLDRLQNVYIALDQTLTNSLRKYRTI